MSGNNPCGRAWRRLWALLVMAAGAGAMLPAQAQVLETSGPAGNTQAIASGVPVYQSFSHDSATPTYALGAIALQLARSTSAAPQTITVTLLAGAHNGVVVGSATLPSSSISSTLAWRLFDFSGTTLNDSQVYFLRIESNAFDGLVQAGIHNVDVYANGSYHSSAGIPDITRDVAFQAWAPNTAPIAVGDAISVLRGTNQTVLASGASSVLANDSDAQGDPLTAALVTGPLHGVLTLNPNGTFNYVHGGGAGASDSFTYEARDAWGPSAPVTVSIAVSDHCFPIAATPCPSIPVGPLPGFALDFDTPAGGVSDTGFTLVLDPQQNRYPMTPSVPTLPGYEPALIARTGGKLVITSTRGSLTQTIADAAGNNSQVNALGVGVPLTQPITIGATLSDVAFPVTGNGEHGGLWFGLDDDNYVRLVLANRTGAGLGDIELRREIGGVTSGTAANTRLAPVSNIDGATVRLELRLVPGSNLVQGYYASSTGETGILGPLALPASFFTGTMLPDTVTGPMPFAGVLTTSRNNAGTPVSYAFDNFTITGIGQPPVAIADALTVTAGGVQTVLSSGATSVLANDTDPEGDTITAALVTGPANGTLTLNANGTFTYTHNNSATTSDSFSYRASDGLQQSAPVTVAISITATCTPLTLAPCATVPVTVPGATPFLLAFDAPAGGLAGTGLTAAPNRSVLSQPATTSIPAVPGFEPNNLAVSGGRLLVTATRGAFHNASNNQINALAVGLSPTRLFRTRVDIVNAPFPAANLSEQSGLWFGRDEDNMVRLAVNNRDGAGNGVVELRLETGGASTATSVNVTNVNTATITLQLTVDPATLQATGSFVSTTGESGTLAPITLPAATLAGLTLPDGSGPLSFAGIFASSRNNGALPALQFAFDNFTVEGANTAPVATADALTVAEGGTATVLTGGASSVLANDGDVDGDTLAAELVSAPDNGTLTLNADGSFSYVHDGSETTSDSFTYRANDSLLPSNTVTVTITVTPVNDAPAALADVLGVAEGGTATVLTGGATSLLANDTDTENGALTAVLVTGPANGTLALNPNGTFAYTHNGSETSADSFSYRASDGGLLSNVATVSIVVLPVNDAPIAVADAIVLAEGGSTGVLVSGAASVLANDSDAETDPLSAVLASGPVNGTLTLNADGGFVYTHNGGETAGDSFSYRANDGIANSNAVSVSITITPVNDAPIAGNDAYSVNEDGTLTVIAANRVTLNDTDAEGQALTATLVAGPAQGTLAFNAGGTFTYTPAPNFNGPVTFTYRVSDGALDSNVATVTIIVNSIGDAPVGGADAYSVVRGGTLTVAAPGLLANDADPDGDAISVLSIFSLPTRGTLTFGANGAFTYVHDGSASTSDSFVYVLADTDPSTPNVNVTVTLTITSNTPPVAVADAIAVDEGGVATVLTGGATSVLANDTDAEGNALTAVIISTTMHGSLALNTDGTFSYTHDGSETDTDTFSYFATDGMGASNIASVSITVAPINDMPVAVADAIALTEGGTATTLTGGATSVLANDVDAENNALVAVLVGSASHGTLTLNPDGSFSYVHDGSETASDAFSYRTSDGSADSNTVTVSIAITLVDDAPIALPDALTVAEGEAIAMLDGGAASVLVNDSDEENDPLTVAVVAQPLHGALTLNPDGSLLYVHDGGEASVDSFTYVATAAGLDSNVATVSITITPFDDAPVANADAIAVAEGGTATVLVGGASSVLANDTDAEGDTLSATLATGTANGALTLNPDGSFSYVHDGSETTSDSFTYRANDGSTDSDIATVSIAITADNDAPVAVADAITVAEGDVVTALPGGGTSVLANDVDSDGDVLSATLIDASVHGTLTLAADGTFSYAHDGGETTADAFTYSATDGDSTSAPATVTITIAPVNDAPQNTLLPAAATAANEALVLSAAHGTAPRVDDVDAGTIELTLAVSSGTLRLAGVAGLTFDSGDGVDDATMRFVGTLAAVNAALDGLRFDPAPDSAAAVTLTMTSNDLGQRGAGGVLTDSDTLTITIAADVPQVTGLSSSSADGLYGVGEHIGIAVEFDRPVVVDPAGGTPQLQLETGSDDAFATFVPSPTASNVLRFDYIVRAGDSSVDLDHASITALDANGATLRSASGGDALLALPAPGSPASLAAQHALVVDGIAPRVRQVEVPPPARYAAGDTLEFRVRLDEAVDVSGGTPRIAIVLDTGGAAWAQYAGGSGSPVLTFRYVVAPAHADDTGIALAASVDANGAGISDPAGNPASLALQGVGATDAVLIGSGAVAPPPPLVVPTGGTLAWLALFASMLMLAGPALRRTRG